MMEKERLPEASPLAATVSPGGEATACKPGERGIWQISQLRAKASKAEWRDNRVVGESLERFQNPEMKPRNQFLQREAYSPSLADQLAFQPLGSPARVSRPTERESPSLGSLQQGEIEQPPQTSDQPSLSLHQLIEALQQLGVVQKPGELQPVSLQMREAQHVQQPLRGLLQQRASPPPAVQQQRRPLQPPLAQPPLGDLQQQGAPPAPAGQQQRAQQPLDQQAGWGQQQQRAQQPLDQQAGWGQQQLGAPQAWRLDQQPGWGQQPQPQWRPQQPVFAPPFKATFDGDPEKLLFFLNQVRSHLNRWAYLYPEPGAMVGVITSNLEGEASEWLDNLYSKQAPELEDPHLFLLSLRERFEDPSIGLKAAGQIHKIKQAGRPALEYVREFRKVAGRIEGWPEQCLLHHFIEGLDDHLAQACIYREVPDRLQDWYQTAVKLDVKLSRYKKPPSPEIEPKPERPRRQPNPWRPPTTTSTDRPRPPAGPPLACFRCGQGGHRAATCPVPYPRLQNRPEPAMRKKPAQRLTREKSNRLTQEPVAQITPPTQEDAGTPGGPAPALPFFDSDDEGENDPMEDNLHWSEDYSESSHESLEREPDPWRVRRETQAERSHEPESTTSMEEKLRKLQEERMCKVCMDKDVSIVLVPCGHLVVCAECAPNLSRCPICRGDIRDSMKAFLS